MKQAIVRSLTEKGFYFMQDIIIDTHFRFLLPKLGKKAYSDLEAEILKNGVRDPLVLWGNILIDGYNRYSIATEHGLPFSTVSLEFGSRKTTGQVHCLPCLVKPDEYGKQY